MTPKPTVLLLKSSSDDDREDPYVAQLAARGFDPVLLPVLETTFANQKELQHTILSGPGHSFNGVIVTSSRAAEAWKDAARHLSSDGRGNEDGGWQSVPFYAVGEKTAGVLRSIGSVAAPAYSPSPAYVRGAAESGTSERLARFILDDSPNRSPVGALLELVGDKNKDTLRVILRDAGLASSMLQVYGTQSSSTFERDLDEVLQNIPEEPRIWIALFAPSASAFAIPHLERRMRLPFTVATSLKSASNLETRIAAIGPTTATFLRDKLGLEVAAVAAQPDATQLADAIARYRPEEAS